MMSGRPYGISLALAFALGAVLAMGGPLQAATAVIYEPFDDGDSSLNGNTAGLGLTGTWSATSGWTVGTGSLSYGTLQTAGNQADYNGGNGYCYASTDSSLSDAGLLNDGETLWFSMVVNTPISGGSNPDTGFAFATDRINGTNNIPLVAGQGIGWAIKNDNLRACTWDNAKNQDAGISVARNTVMLIVGQIVWGADASSADTVNLYLPDTSLNLGSVVSSQTGVLDQANFDLITCGLKTNTGLGIDEIRFGATYDDVLGEKPNLSLRVDPVTGDTSILGNAVRTVDINYYQITSAGDSLDAANWTSLADQDFDGNGPADGSGNGWEEAGGSGKEALAEAFLLGNSTIGVSQSVSLGKGYDTAVNAKDLVFQYRIDSGEILEGAVEYVTSALPGDANLDGVVDAADYVAFKAGFGMASGAKYQNGDFDLDGDVDLNDLAILNANFGQAAAGATIPEPASLALLACGVAAMATRRKNRFARGGNCVRGRPTAKSDRRGGE